MSPKHLLLLVAVSCCVPVLSDAQLFTDWSDSLGLSITNSAEFSFASGLSFDDIDRDGRDDLTFLSGSDSVLIMLNTDSGWVTLPAPDITGDLKQATWVDFDNDGDSDLFITGNNGKSGLFRNDGSLQLTEVTPNLGIDFPATMDSYGHAWADYDRDGWLDVYICNYNLDNHTNLLLHNNGDGTFTDVTSAANIGNGFHSTFMAGWTDFNEDRYPELYVANDRNEGNAFYRNNTMGGFVNVAPTYDLDIPMEAMCVSWCDYDRDLDFDLYITNGPIGNLMLERSGNQPWSNVAQELGIQVNSTCWGALWADFDHNGWEDLYVSNANIYNDIDVLFMRDSEGVFYQSENAGCTEPDLAAYANARGDLDNDGAYDIAVTTYGNDHYRIYHNEIETGNVVRITLEGVISNRDAVGSMVTWYTDGVAHRFYTECGSNYLAQNSRHHLLGIGSSEMIDSIRVAWPSGMNDTWYGLPAGSNWNLQEGGSLSVSIVVSPDTVFCENVNALLQVPAAWENIQWNNGSHSPNLIVTSPGWYSVTVTNSFGFEVTDSVYLSLSQAPELEMDILHPSCYGLSDGQIILTELPGWEPVWNNTIQAWMLDSIGAGTYSLMLTATDGCAYPFEVNVVQPEPLSLSSSVHHVTCYGGADGSIGLEITGGTPPYSDPSNTWNNLSAGSYEIVITDSLGCTSTSVAEVQEPQSILWSAELTHACPGQTGIAELFVTGGTGPTAVIWSSNPDDLLPGEHTFLITDSVGCTIDGTILIEELPAMEIVPAISSPTELSAGWVELVITGGTPPFEVDWNQGDTGVIADSLNAGIYSAWIMDAAGCDTTFTIEMIIDDIREPSGAAVVITGAEGWWISGRTVPDQIRLIDVAGRVVYWTRPAQVPVFIPFPGESGIWFVLMEFDSGRSDLFKVYGP